MYNKTDSNITFTNINGSSNAYINKNISYENNNYELHDKGELDYDSLDINKISSSVTGAKNGEYVKANEDVFKSADLSYEIIDGNVAVIKNGDVPIGYTTTDGLNIVNREDGYSSVIEEIDTNSFSVSRPNAPTNPIDYSNLKKEIDTTKVENYEKVLSQNRDDLIMDKKLEDLEQTHSIADEVKLRKEFNEKYNNIAKFADKSYDKKGFWGHGTTYGPDGEKIDFDSRKEKDGVINYYKDNRIFKTIYPDGRVAFEKDKYGVSSQSDTYKINGDGTYDYISSGKKLYRYSYNEYHLYTCSNNDENGPGKLELLYSMTSTGLKKVYHDNGELRAVFNENKETIEMFYEDGSPYYKKGKNGEVNYYYLEDGTKKECYNFSDGTSKLIHYARDGKTIKEIAVGEKLFSSGGNAYTPSLNNKYSDVKFSETAEVRYYDENRNATKVETADGGLLTYTENGKVVTRNQRADSLQKIIDKVNWDDGRLQDALNVENYNAYLKDSKEYYDSDGNLQYVELTGAGLEGHENDYAKIYPDGSCEYASGNKYYKIESDGSRYEKGPRMQDEIEESYYGSDGTLLKSYINGSLWLERQSNGDLYNYDPNGNVWMITNEKEHKTITYLHGTEYTSITDENGVTEYADGVLSSIKNLDGTKTYYSKNGQISSIEENNIRTSFYQENIKQVYDTETNTSQWYKDDSLIYSGAYDNFRCYSTGGENGDLHTITKIEMLDDNGNYITLYE